MLEAQVQTGWVASIEKKGPTDAFHFWLLSWLKRFAAATLQGTGFHRQHYTAMFKYHRVTILFSKAKAECPRHLRSASKVNVSQVKVISVGVAPGPGESARKIIAKRGRATAC